MKPPMAPSSASRHQQPFKPGAQMVATTSKQCQTEPDPAELALTQLQFELEQLSETNGNIAAENAQLKHELSD